MALRMQQSTQSLKALRYEDVKDGIPPRRGNSPLRPSSPAFLPTSRDSNSSIGSTRPGTSPAPSPRKTPSLLSSQLKRDSGIAPSVSTIGAASTYTDGGGGGGAAKSSTLPTIVVQDEECVEVPDRSPSLSSLTRGRDSRQPRQQPPARMAKSASPPRVSTAKSLTGPETTDSDARASADDIGLEDLTSDKIAFSSRGSLLYGGRRMHMQELIQAQGEDKDGVRQSVVGSPTPAEQPAARHSSEKAVVVTREKEQGRDKEKERRTDVVAASSPAEQDTTRPGLKTGRRQPSSQMLQAAFHGGRVLSAEENTFSLKVRSMYDYGSEQAAEWANIASIATSQQTTTDKTERNTHTPDVALDNLEVGKARSQTGKHSSVVDNRSSTISNYSREVHEIAGGLEDWQDVDAINVDRYGYIRQFRTPPRSSDSPARHVNGMQRVATSLHVAAAQPRKERGRLHRRFSDARSSRSMPPPAASRPWLSKKGPGSIHSTVSTQSTTANVKNAFRSRNKRLLADAGDMLTLPPGLAEIAEHEDAGKTASALKQRESVREEKWRKMARPVKRTKEAKGGGMHFDFDTTDPKLLERAWKGIPDVWRATAWHSFLAASAKKRNSPTTDEELIGQFHKLQNMGCADDVQIDVDVPRTVQLHVMFRRRYRGGQRLLFRVLHAMALYFPEVGYVQGMASIASTLLCYFDEENAFVMMVRMWQLRGLETFFIEDFHGLMAALEQFENDWLAGGDVAMKLSELGITSTTYGTRWYLTLFNMSMPFQAQLRVWDVFLLLGDDTEAIKNRSTTRSSDVAASGKANPSTSSHPFGGADLAVLHATSAALIDATRGIIMDSDFENAMKVLTSFVPIKDEDLLMRVARAEWKMQHKKKTLLPPPPMTDTSGSKSAIGTRRV